ncbi:MAG: hypothetical protein K0Q43_1100 [Ramlibacter sp.]|nr:hypothetical protein [Ramlibacter sp.]
MAMQDKPDTPVQNSEPAATARPVRNLQIKAALLLLFTGLLIAASVLYLLYARGVFQPTQTLVLMAEDSEGVVVGMDMTFSGFPIGRVRRVELAETGNVRIVIDVPKKDAHWLRTSSIDATAELPRVLASAKEVLENVSRMTAQDAGLRATLDNLQEVTAKLKGPRGALGVMFGNEADAQKLVAALDRTNVLLARVDSLAAKADTQVFGPDGVMTEARATVVQLNGLLAETRESLKKVDAVLVEAQGISANVRGATTDLGALRGDVEANLQKIEGMINELNRKWPFARDTQVKLP